MTIQQLIDEQNADIRDQTLPSSITKENVTQCLTDITNELLARGFCRVATTADLSTLESTNFLLANVDGYGLFYWSDSGSPNGPTIFAAADTGVYILYAWVSASPIGSTQNASQSIFGWQNF